LIGIYGGTIDVLRNIAQYVPGLGDVERFCQPGTDPVLH
jgi:hypothetical protein